MLAVQIGTAGTGALAELRRYNAVSVARLDPAAGRSTVDDLLSTVDGRRLVVLADLAGLSRIVLRLLRRGLLPSTEVAAIVDSPQWTRLVGLPRGSRAVAVAATGVAAPLGLVRDDQGGIVLAGVTMRPATGRRFGMRAYVEDTELVNAQVRDLVVRPSAAGLRATAGLGSWRHRAEVGRAVTLSCEPATVVVDGVELPNPRRRATFWYDPDCWRLVRPAPRHQG
jgi:hypothetical protein